MEEDSAYGKDNDQRRPRAPKDGSHCLCRKCCNNKGAMGKSWLRLSDVTTQFSDDKARREGSLGQTT